MSSWIPLSLISGFSVAIEVILIKRISNKSDDIDTDVLSLMLRIYGVGFIALYLIYKYLRNKNCDATNISNTICCKDHILSLICAGFVSALAVLTYYRAVKIAPMTGYPNTIRLIYVVLVFIGGFLFLGEKPSEVKAQVWVGISLLLLGAAMVGIWA